MTNKEILSFKEEITEKYENRYKDLNKTQKDKITVEEFKKELTKEQVVKLEELKSICSQNSQKTNTLLEKINLFTENLNEKSTYSFSSDLIFLEKQRDKQEEENKKNNKDNITTSYIVRLLEDTIDLSNLNDEELLYLNHYIIDNKMDINETRFNIYFQSKNSLNENIVKSFKKQIDSSISDLKKFLLNDIKIHFSTEDSDSFVKHLENFSNNKLAEIKSWLLLFKHDYDQMTQEQKDKIKTTKDMLTYINNAAMNGNKPFKFKNKKSLSFEFKDGGSGRIDTLYKDCNNNLSAIDCTVDDSGNIDRKNGLFVSNQQIPRHFYMYLLYSKYNNENPNIKVNELNDMVSNEVGDIFEKKDSLNKEIYEKTKKLIEELESKNIPINYAFFADINLQPSTNKLIRTFHNTIYNSLHNISGLTDKKSVIAQDYEIEYMELLLKTTSNVSIGNIYNLDLITKEESEVEERIFDKENNKMNDFTFDILLKYMKDLKEFPNKKNKERTNIFKENEIIKGYLIKQRNSGGEEEQLIKLVNNLDMLVNKNTTRKSLIGDFLFINFVKNPNLWNELKIEEKDFFINTFKGLSSHHSFDHLNSAHNEINNSQRANKLQEEQNKIKINTIVSIIKAPKEMKDFARSMSVGEGKLITEEEYSKLLIYTEENIFIELLESNGKKELVNKIKEKKEKEIDFKLSKFLVEHYLENNTENKNSIISQIELLKSKYNMEELPIEMEEELERQIQEILNKDNVDISKEETKELSKEITKTTINKFK